MKYQLIVNLEALTAILSFPLLTSASLRLPPNVIYGQPNVNSVPRELQTGSTSSDKTRCRALPGDANWPSQSSWNALNRTVGGRLIRGQPLPANTCYGSSTDRSACASLQSEWPTVEPYLDDPVNVMCPYWFNNTCSPFPELSSSCSSGNLASYAINVTGTQDIIAGLAFAKTNNIRLTIKNTGHDLLGRSSGAGSLALWTHHLKDVSFFTYKSKTYTGPAAKLGAGIQVHEAYAAASANGLRVTGGGCPTVGLAGWLPGGGHGPLSSQYGLGADNALEFEVITADGKHLVASATQNSDLYWALAGGGSGNYAVLVSITLRAYKDGPVAGSKFIFLNTDADAYWAAISSWLKHLLVLDDQYPTLKTAVTFTSSYFYLDFATFADKTAAELDLALQPFYQDVAKLGIKLVNNETVVQPSFIEHYDHFTGSGPEPVNQTVGNRLIPRDTVRNNLAAFVNTIRNITDDQPDAVFVFVGTNVSYKNVGTKAGANSVNPAWRDALLLLNFGRFLAPDASWAEMQAQQAEVNGWQDTFRKLMPNGGGYLNEGTWDNPNWKYDYFGQYYDKLAQIKTKYDADQLLYTYAAVGNDLVWNVDATGRMCRRSN